MAKTYVYVESAEVLEDDVPLVTNPEVLLICKEVDEDTPDEEITLFVNSAHIIVCEHLDGYGISTARLALIERYLAAHFAAITYPPAAFESVGKVQQSYSLKIALNLDQTRYGQQAKVFDPTGQLGRLNSGVLSKRFGISWLGITQEEWEETYADSQES